MAVNIEQGVVRWLQIYKIREFHVTITRTDLVGVSTESLPGIVATVRNNRGDNLSGASATATISVGLKRGTSDHRRCTRRTS